MNEHIYYNCAVDNIDNKNNSDQEHEPNLEFSEQNNDPIITDTENYRFAVCNFRLDTAANVARFIPTIKFNDASNISDLEKNRTIYEIGISFTASDGSIILSRQSVIFSPQDKTINNGNPPNFINGNYDVLSNYYNIYQIEHFLVLCNNALEECLKNLSGLITYYGYASEYTNPATSIPYFTYDINSSLISLNADINHFNSNDANGLGIHMNTSFYRIFNTLPSLTESTLFKTTSVYSATDYETKTLKNFKLITNNFNNQITLFADNVKQIDGTTADNIENLVITQHDSTSGIMNPYSGLSIESYSIPCRNTLQSGTYYYENGIMQSNNEDAINILEINDFTMTETSLGVYYSPNYLRWLDLMPQRELTKINLIFYLKLKTGQKIPLKLSSGGSMNIKLLFQRI